MARTTDGKEIKQILQLKAQAVNADLTDLFAAEEIQQIIGSHNSIRRILNNAAEYFRYKYKNIPLPQHQDKETDEQSTIVTRLDRLESQQNRLERLLTNIAQAFGNFATGTADTSKTIDDSHSTVTQTTQIPLDLEPSLEQKVIDHLVNQQKILERDYSEAEILLDEKDIGKLQDIIEAFKQITFLETDVLPTKRVLPSHRLVSNKQLCIGFISSCKSSKFTSRIQNFNEFVATQEHLSFILWKDVRSDSINPKTIGYKEIDKLNNTKNGAFLSFDRHERIIFESIYKFISDIYNQDLEIDIETEFKPALEIVAQHFPDYWLIEKLL